MRLGVLLTHPIQYYTPLLRALAERLDLHVYYAHRPTAKEQGAGFGVAFNWDVDLLSGYDHTFLRNEASRPDVSSFGGCDTPEIKRIIAQERFDAFLVPGWYTRSAWQALWACKRTGTPVLVRGDSHLGNPRSLLIRWGKRVIYRALLPLFDGYLPVGTRSAEYFLAHGARMERLFRVPYFVDSALFRGAANQARVDRVALRSSFGLQPDSSVVLLAGKLVPVKRPVDFVEAIARLASRRPDIEGLIVGDGPLRNDVEAVIARTNAPVTLAGFRNQSEMPRAYAAADLLALPSAWETWGLVVNEAMTCGLPAVVSDVVGCGPDLVEEGRTGAIHRTGDVASLAAAIERGLNLAGTPELHEALEEKLRLHSLDAATTGVLRAVQTVGRRGRRSLGLPSGTPSRL